MVYANIDDILKTIILRDLLPNIADDNGNVSATAKQLGMAMQTLSKWWNKAN